MLYSAVPRPSVWPMTSTPSVVVDMHSMFFCKSPLAVSSRLYWSKPKYTSSSVHDGFWPVPPCSPTQTPLMQSCHSSQSVSTSHCPLRRHFPASVHLPPSPHSAFAVQATHAWSLHTLPSGQSPSPEHHPSFGLQAPLSHCWPSGQSVSSAHWAHFLFRHFSPAWQSLSPSQPGYLGFLVGQPAARRATAANRITCRMLGTLVAPRPSSNIGEQANKTTM